ncbi:hypothetical protein FACS1894130_02340 [Spirochaetia bacterium]|nr:hypothetical protein FACS1894130_02340 [Spirochaetia bacterium]
MSNSPKRKTSYTGIEFFMSIVKTFVKKIIGKMGFTIARNQGNVNNQSYYCKALTGMSGYNISINSDLTVSCSCQDSQNEGLLGDLKKQTLKEIFEGKKANNFRKSLADGVLPAPNICSLCPELIKAPRFVADYYTRHFGMPVNGIMIENCVSCNYKCIYCPSKNLKSYRSSNIISYEDIILIGNKRIEL